MSYTINDLSKHKKEMTGAEMKVPAILHVSSELMPNDDTLGEIADVAASGYAFHHVAAMSDVHSKTGRKNPTGTVVASERFLLPQINDTAPNCGMRLIKTNLTEENLSEHEISTLFHQLVHSIPTKKYIGTVIPFRLVMDICCKGIAPVKEYFKTRIKNEVENTFQKGNFFDEEVSERDILDVLPKLFLNIGKYRLGILGAAGNHFLDLMKITQIKEPVIAEKFGIAEGQYVFLLHTGSGLLGQYASYFYTPKKKEHFSQRIILELGKLTFDSQIGRIYKLLAKKIARYKNKKEFFAYDGDTMEGRMYLRAHNAAANQGFANRSILTHHLDQTIQDVLDVDPELELLYDMPHVFVDRENHFGKDVWVHRNGAVRANGPKRMGHHPTFSVTGEPVFIPSSMSTAAYLCVGTDENESTFFSASHGTGRRKTPRPDTPTSRADLVDKMRERRVKIYNAKSKEVLLQDSAYYKDVEEVIAGMEENKIVKVVAKMEPVAVLMY